MRILITNDDGVFAPGIAELARGLHAAFGDEHDLMVVAPLTDHSGASAAVGPVYERESIPYEHVDIPGLADVPTFGIDGSPALSVILGCIEGFGPKPDMIVSGINHGINTGRSALHSGTVGAALTGAQFGVRGLAVSIAWASEPDSWGTAVDLALGDRAGPGRRRARHRAEPQRAGRGGVRSQGTPPRHPRTHGTDPGGPARAHPDAGGRPGGRPDRRGHRAGPARCGCVPIRERSGPSSSPDPTPPW